MKKIFLIALTAFFFSAVSAQDSTTTREGVLKKAGKANDHLMLQFGYTGWAGIPDTINTKGFPRTFNAYFMLDFPFKSAKKFSAAIGVGVAYDNIYFDKTFVDIKGTTENLRFINQADTNHFKKHKIGTIYLEAPIELRFVADPENSDRSWKGAIGVKAGWLAKAFTRSRTLETRAGSVINDYTVKEMQKRYFNTTRISATARVGWGHFSLFGSFQLTNLFKDGVAPEVRPYTVGLTLSGL